MPGVVHHSQLARKYNSNHALPKAVTAAAAATAGSAAAGSAAAAQPAESDAAIGGGVWAENNGDDDEWGTWRGNTSQMKKPRIDQSDGPKPKALTYN